MILSVSRRTDIPAFFGKWFMRRIEEGYFHWISPFNANLVKEVKLNPADIDALVFWTKNPKTFMKFLDDPLLKQYNYYFHFTLNDYSKTFEPNVPPIDERITTFKELSEKIGGDKVIWRYDPIIFSSETPVEYHVEKFGNIANQLRGDTSRVIISFLDFYGKVENRLKKLEQTSGTTIFDITQTDYRNELLRLSEGIKKLADKNSLEVFTCAENIELKDIGIQRGSCIDGDLINNLFNLNKKFKKDKKQRKECLCAEAVDIGIYNTCRAQCSYCYANISEKAIVNNLKKHDVNSRSLISCKDGIEILYDHPKKNDELKQKTIPFAGS